MQSTRRPVETNTLRWSWLNALVSYETIHRHYHLIHEIEDQCIEACFVSRLPTDVLTPAYMNPCAPRKKEYQVDAHELYHVV